MEMVYLTLTTVLLAAAARVGWEAAGAVGAAINEFCIGFMRGYRRSRKGGHDGQA